MGEGGRGGGRGWNLNFDRTGQDLNFEKGVTGKEGVIFQGVLQFLQRNLKSEIFNDKKSF